MWLISIHAAGHARCKLGPALLIESVRGGHWGCRDDRAVLQHFHAEGEEI